jgi:signal transduction histidine kinase
MRSWRSSAAYRIALANFGAFAIGLALLGAVVFVVMHIAFTRQLDASIADEAQTLVEEYGSGGNRELMEAIAERESSGSPSRMLYAVYSSDGRRLAGSLNAPRPRLGLRDITFIDPLEGPDEARGIGIDLSREERLLVVADTDWIERIDNTVIAVFGAAFLVACLLGLAGAAILGGYLQRRLQSISQTAEAIIRGDIRKRMPVGPRRDEFDELAVTLNRMLDRIEGLLENLRQVSSDIAHDLRTPLARLRTSLEQGTPSGDAPNAAVIENAVRQVDEVLSLFAAILRIAEVESGETRRFFRPVDLSALVTELAESFAPAVQDEGGTLLWSIKPGLTIEGDRELLAQAVINLLENAQRHTPKGTVIRLTLAATSRVVFVQVRDDGPGVPKADLARIEKRFARLESSRNTVGYGLGLNLASAVAKLHGGQLVLKNAQPGLSGTIDLPRAALRKSIAEHEEDKEPVG